MRKIFILLMLLNSFTTMASCEVFIPVKYFHHDSGYSINFNFEKLLAPKGYVEVENPEAPNVLFIEGEELKGRFHKALAKMSLGDLKVSAQVICLTQLCAISDYAKAFNKTYKIFARQLPECHK
jgi:hypothetical protein